MLTSRFVNLVKLPVWAEMSGIYIAHYTLVRLFKINGLVEQLTDQPYSNLARIFTKAIGSHSHSCEQHVMLGSNEPRDCH